MFIHHAVFSLSLEEPVLPLQICCPHSVFSDTFFSVHSLLTPVPKVSAFRLHLKVVATQLKVAATCKYRLHLKVPESFKLFHALMFSAIELFISSISMLMIATDHTMRAVP